jgi:RimJ/RimL family protein N-acetyltransferase
MELFPPDPPLDDGEVALRLWTAADVPAITAACQDPEISRFTLVPAPYTEGDARGFVADAARQLEAGAGIHFAVTDSRTGRILGSIGLETRDWPVAEVGYWIDREARGRGIATRALRLLSRWTLHELGAARLQLVTPPENVASQLVAERAGFQREGVLRAALVTKGRRTDCVMFSLLPGDRA